MKKQTSFLKKLDINLLFTPKLLHVTLAIQNFIVSPKLPAMSFLNQLDPGTIPIELAKLNLI